ncbi:MAG: EAL domain-containing protein [Candidatus Velthaea sp.]
MLDVPIALVVLGSNESGPSIVAGSGSSNETIATAARRCRGRLDEAKLRIAPEDAPIRAGAGLAIVSSEKVRLGTLSVFDTRRRVFTPSELRRLTDFGDLVAAQLMLHARSLQVEAQLAALNAASPSAIIFAHRDGTIGSWNAGASRLLGWLPDEMIGKEYALAPPDRVEEVQRLRRINLERGEIFHGVETKRLTRAGLLLDVSISAGPIRDANGDISGTVVIMDDHTQRNRLREAERKRSRILELAANDAPLTQILAGLVESVEFSIDDSICTILRCKGNALEHVASGPALPPMWIEAISQARIGPSEGSCGTAAYFGKTIIVDDIATDARWETPRPLALQLGLQACWSAPIFNAQGIVHGTLAVYSHRPRLPTEDQLRVMHDAARLASIAIEGQRSRDRLEDLALRDTLTGLPNRAVFEDRLRHAIEAAKRTRERVFIGLLDLDRFKLINDTLGHVVGDQLLIEVANRLRQAARPQDTIARMGGDEFLFLLTGVENRDTAEGIARRVLAELDHSFSPSGNELFVHASLGFSVYPDDATDPTQLLRLADRVMYEVKARQTRIGFHERDSGETALAKLPLETALYRALDKHEFVLHYEPQIGRGNRLQGAEAHVLWNHPDLGLLSGEHFMGVAEEVGLSVPIGAWALKEACLFARRWKAAGGSGCVAINVSARQCRSRHFVATAIDAIKDAGIVPAQLSLEISETMIGRSFDGVATALVELRSFGVHTAIDDFGTGSSNLHNLKNLPIDSVKIDRSFLADVDAVDDRAIVDAMVALGRASHLAVAADGIETEAQLALVLASGCEIAQGPLFAAAMPEDAFLRWSPANNAASHPASLWTAFDAEREAITRLSSELDKQSRTTSDDLSPLCAPETKSP